MINVYIGIGITVFIYFLYFILIISNNRRLEKYIKKSKETNLIRARYKINYDKVSHKLVANIFAITNALIIGLTYIVIGFIDNYILKLFVAFLMFLLLVVLSYLLIGSYIKKKESK